LSFWLVMVIAGLATYILRLSFIVLIGRREVSLLAPRALRFIPPAVLTAILVPDILLPSGALDLSLSNERLLAGIVAILVAWRTKNAVLTVIIGMAVLWGLKALGG
jgi:branched-subunit amino acid transport protein